MCVGGGALKSWMHAVFYVQNEKLNNGGESLIDALEGGGIFPRRSTLEIKICRSGENIITCIYNTHETVCT